MRNFRLTIEYDGSDFSGFQKQPDCRTVQGELEKRLSELLSEPIKVIGAGRTDAGVHATGQVVNFRTSRPFSAAQAADIINAHLPLDLTVRKAEEVDNDFHARRLAKSRTYRYTILNTPQRSARLARFVGWIKEPLSSEAMNRAAAMLVGEHDFASFQAAGSPTKTSFRRLIRGVCKRLGNFVWVVLEADAFLYQMARIIVASLCLVGRGEKEAIWVEEILKGRDRGLAPAPAAPQGLCLVSVKY